ncbi:MAG TPA: hypothetical protein DCQ12_01500 [Candidatus Cloacimonas sp.]|jgi:Tfp pilus assembly major pilin PilA|nr:hypothetical protein [Candidatus Cloacimonas sp.]
MKLPIMGEKPNSKHEKINPMTILRQARGFTLIEALVLVVVLVILTTSLYIGIIYAEKTLATNYRDRVVMLLLAGQLELEYYRHENGQPFQLQKNVEYVIQQREKGHPITGRMSVTASVGTDVTNERSIPFTALTATMTWKDPTTDQVRTLSMREDFF